MRQFLFVWENHSHTPFTCCRENLFMTWSIRRALILLLSLGLFGAWSLSTSFAFQPDIIELQPPTPPTEPTPKPTPTPSGSMTSAIQLPVDPDLKLEIRAAQEYVKVREWALAIDKLQKMLNRIDNDFTPVTHQKVDGSTTTTLANVRVVANEMISKLPKEGLDFYKLEFGGKAKAMLDTAKDSGNPDLLADVMRLYLFTDAGAEATELLGTYSLDRGQYSRAALCFARLMQRQPLKAMDSKTLFKAAIAFRKVGDAASEKLVWKQLKRNGDTLTFGDTRISPETAEQWVNKLANVAQFLADMRSREYFGGNPSRSGQGVGGTAYLKPDFVGKTYRQPLTRSHIESAITDLQSQDEAILPAFFPIATTVSSDVRGETVKLPLIIYRDNSGLSARCATDLTFEGKAYKKGDLLWSSVQFAWGMDGMTDPDFGLASMHADLNTWVQRYRSTRLSHLILENSVVGSISTDRKRIYAIDDFVVPPYVHPNGVNSSGIKTTKVKLAVHSNKLLAFDADTGKYAWSAGGSSKDENNQQNQAPLLDHVFLGPPLPMRGKLYVLAEKKEDLFLVTLEPESGHVVGEPLRLATTRESVVTNVHRRMNASHLSYGDGIMVCPTNAGGILGVDLMTRDLIWLYEYREKRTASSTRNPNQPVPPGGFPKPGQPGFNGSGVTPPSNWKISPPIVQSGKVVVAPPDATSIHCFSLRDGLPLWKVGRGSDDLYLAGVFKGKVLVVSKKSIRALSLETGTQLWNLETGLPSGQGIASGDVYYLPLRKGKTSRQPEICAINIKEGYIQGHTIAVTEIPGEAAPKEVEVPGNLVFFDGQVVSQSAMKITAYPQLTTRIEQLNAQVKEKPTDPKLLTMRGNLRLYNGELALAVEDLRSALDNNPPEGLKEQTQKLLYESFTEYFQRDFPAAEKYLDEYKEMCKVVKEGMAGPELAQAQEQEKIRMRNFYTLLGKGREQQRKFVEAYRSYVGLTKQEDLDSEEMLSVIDEPHVTANPVVWARGRIQTMIAKATPEERKPLEDVIRKELDEVRKSGSLRDLRYLVRLFGSRLQVSREAQMELARRLTAKADNLSLIQAELHLKRLQSATEDRELGAQAVELLAQISLKKESMEDAAFYYHILGRDFADVVVRDGKTGEEITRDLPTDRRLMLHLNVPEPVISATNIQVKSLSERNSTYLENEHLFVPTGEVLPSLQRYKLVVRPNYREIRIIDRMTGKDWSFRLQSNEFTSSLAYHRGNNPRIDPKYPYFAVGHLAVMRVDYVVYGIDMRSKTKLWSKDLMGTRRSNYKQHTVNPDGSVMVIYQDGWSQSFGAERPLSAKVVCVQTRDALEGLDPITGKVLWSRSDVGGHTHLYNDSNYIYAIEIIDGDPGRTRVFRAEDGVEVRVRDFSTLYARRLRMRGGKLIVSEEGAAGARVIRQYDVVTGKEDWRHTFTAQTKALLSEAKDYVGVVDESTGKVSLIDVRQGKITIETSVDNPKDVADMQTMHLLQDREYVYLACHGNDNPLNTNYLATNMMPYSGRRTIPINGAVYSFDRKTGKRNWRFRPKLQLQNGDEYQPVPAMMVVEQFGDLPVVIFTSRFSIRQANFGYVPYVDTQIVSKASGKLLRHDTQQNNSSGQFHTLRVDPAANQVDLISYNQTIRMLINGATGKSTGSTNQPQGGGSSVPATGQGPVNRPGVIIRGRPVPLPAPQIEFPIRRRR